MSKKIFTEQEILELSKNKYVKNVTAKGITYTNEFKLQFIAEYENGKTSRAIFEDAGFDVIGKKMTIVGAGGAATAICIQAALDGVAELSIFNQDDEFFARAEETVKKINEKTNCKAKLFRLEDKEALRTEIADSVIFTNGTGMGMKPYVGQTYIEKDMLRPDLIVSDVVYQPAKTRLLELAEEVGCPTINGLGMMLFQGAEAFKCWTGQEMPIDHMKEFLFGDK